MNFKGRGLSKTLHVQVTPAEYAELKERCAQSTCTTWSEYARTILLGMPLTVFYRDKAFDEILEEVIQVRNALEDMLLVKTWSPSAEARVIQLAEAMQKHMNFISDHYAGKGGNK